MFLLESLLDCAVYELNPYSASACSNGLAMLWFFYFELGCTRAVALDRVCWSGSAGQRKAGSPGF